MHATSADGLRLNTGSQVDLVIQAERGPAELERATLPFTVGCVAARTGARVVVFLAFDAVLLVTRGEVVAPELISSFQAHHGELWAWETSLHAQGMTSADLIDGVATVTLANLTDLVLSGARTIAL